jgi:acetyl-CoA acetyltransferase
VSTLFSTEAAIVGVGYTDFSQASGRTVLELALQAIDRALADAGIERQAVDGLLTYHLGDSVPVLTVARAMGLGDCGWMNDYSGGGSQCASILGDAALVLGAGLADTLVIYRALNGRTGKRMGQVGMGAGDDLESQFLRPYGLLGPVHLFALAAQHYFHERGLGPDLTARVVIDHRSKAAANPKALLRTPLDAQAYFQSPMVASPLRRLDCCLETDGACALVLRRAAGTTAGPRIPVHVRAAIRAGGPGATHADKAGAALSRMFSHYVAPRIFAAAGIGPQQVDLLQLYDAYSFLVPKQLEDFGFLGAGDIAAAYDDGLFGQHGRLPLNLNGGLLSEGYVHGLNNVVEAVEQLRGSAGARQAAAATTALCTGFGGSYGSAALLSVER